MLDSTKISFRQLTASQREELLAKLESKLSIKRIIFETLNNDEIDSKLIFVEIVEIERQIEYIKTY